MALQGNPGQTGVRRQAAGTAPNGAPPAAQGFAPTQATWSAPGTPQQTAAPGAPVRSTQPSTFAGTPGGATDWNSPRAPGNKAGTESGPGILGQWFNQRATGTDPGWEYATGRATDSINKQYTARGGYNSSGATGALSDMYANATSQREGQLDSLAGGASMEHQNTLNGMFTEGNALASGQAGAVGGNTALGAAGMSGASRDQIDLLLAKNGVDQKTRQGELDAIFGAGGIAASAAGGKK